jgi:hypothetical protein
MAGGHERQSGRRSDMADTPESGPGEKKPKRPRVVKTLVQLPKGQVAVYFGKHVAEALEEVTVDMNLYKGVRLSQVLQAVYEQGRKDGARKVKESFDKVMREIPYRNPGKPKKV